MAVQSLQSRTHGRAFGALMERLNSVIKVTAQDEKAGISSSRVGHVAAPTVEPATHLDCLRHPCQPSARGSSRTTCLQEAESCSPACLRAQAWSCRAAASREVLRDQVQAPGYNTSLPLERPAWRAGVLAEDTRHIPAVQNGWFLVACAHRWRDTACAPAWHRCSEDAGTCVAGRGGGVKPTFLS